MIIVDVECIRLYGLQIKRMNLNLNLSLTNVFDLHLLSINNHIEAKTFKEPELLYE